VRRLERAATLISHTGQAVGGRRHLTRCDQARIGHAISGGRNGVSCASHGTIGGERNFHRSCGNIQLAGGAAVVDVLMFLAFVIFIAVCLCLIYRALNSEDD
jgi:hypothetical protein